MLWINKKHVEILGEQTREQYLLKLNKRGAAATETFERRLQMWKEKVQVNLGFHTDPHKLFPDDGTPVPHFTRMLPVNARIKDRAGKDVEGVFNLAVREHENKTRRRSSFGERESTTVHGVHTHPPTRAKRGMRASH